MLHAHLPLAELISSMGKVIARNKFKYVASRHFGGKFAPKLPRYISNALSRVATKNCDAVVAISEYVKNLLLTSGQISNKKLVQFIPYGINIQKFNCDIKNLLDFLYRYYNM